MLNIKKQNLSKYLLSTVLIVGLTTLSIQAWNGLTASPWDKLDYQKWNELVATVQSGIPSGAVMAFNLSACPSSWSAYNDAVWRTIIWVGNGAGSNTTLWDIWWDKSAPAINLAMNLTLNVSNANAANFIPTNWSTLAAGDSTGVSAARIYWDGSTAPNIPLHAGTITGGVSGGWTAPDNMQPYVALLYCVKN